MTRVLYIAYWGALEPLGQSLILPAVAKLAEMGAEITLITFEKPDDLANKEEFKRVKLMLKEAGVKWIGLKYHKNPRNLTTAFDIAHGIAKGILCRVGKSFDIVHARTYPGGLIGLFLAPMIGAKLVYHNEGFNPDEQVDGGVWTYKSRAHRFTKWLENLMYARADGIIALSYRAQEIIENLSAVTRRRIPIIVVPSCVDLEHFKLPEAKSAGQNRDLKLVYVGSVGNRYTPNDIGRFVSTINQEITKVNFQIYSKVNLELVKTMLLKGDLPESDWNLRSIPYSEMPKYLAQHDVGIFFLKQGISEHGCSPTKIGEYWAVGLPVISTPNVSDTDEIIRRENVGVIIESQTKEAYISAFQTVRQLLKDPELPMRCRAAAEKHYALLPACKRQISLYEKLVKS